MALEIYNTLTRRKERFVPLDPDGRRVTIYNCGPTIYDHFHIGNARNFVVMDVVRRYFEWLGYEVRFVQNLTDIEDKIIKRAEEEGVSTEEITAKFKDAYFEDAGKLGIRMADEHPRATEYVAQMVAFMKALEGKGLAYEKNGSLYFRVRGFGEYGKLSGRSVDSMREGARVEVSEEKDDPLDFVLWKAAKPGEPTWDSPWGKGRPGWHSECAVMARELLGETIDIHSGGTDLMFPHHENEIAQHEGLYNRQFARYWMHNGFLNVDSEKMSKSLGNFFKIDEVLAAGHSPETIRLFLLSAAYRHPLDYNETALSEARASVHRINDGLETGKKLLELEGREAGETGRESKDEVAGMYLERFMTAMDDDFNTPRALAVLHDIVSAIHETRQAKPVDLEKLSSLVGTGTTLRDFFGLRPGGAGPGAGAGEPGGESELGEGSAELQLVALLGEVKRMAEVKGAEEVVATIEEKLAWQRIDLKDAVKAPLYWVTHDGIDALSDLAETLIEARRISRQEKAFDIADFIRDGVKDAGLLLEDHPQGTIWKRA